MENVVQHPDILRHVEIKLSNLRSLHIRLTNYLTLKSSQITWKWLVFWGNWWFVLRIGQMIKSWNIQRWRLANLVTSLIFTLNFNVPTQNNPQQTHPSHLKEATGEWFERQNHYKTGNGEVDMKCILEQFAMWINDNFKTYQIEATANPSNKTIIVSFEQMEQTKENARKLIELVEFVKTLVLALA